MKMKIVSVLVCVLMLATVFTVAGSASAAMTPLGKIQVTTDRHLYGPGEDVIVDTTWKPGGLIYIQWPPTYYLYIKQRGTGEIVARGPTWYGEYNPDHDPWIWDQTDDETGKQVRPGRYEARIWGVVPFESAVFQIGGRAITPPCAGHGQASEHNPWC